MTGESSGRSIRSRRTLSKPNVSSKLKPKNTQIVTASVMAIFDHEST